MTDGRFEVVLLSADDPRGGSGRGLRAARRGILIALCSAAVLIGLSGLLESRGSASSSNDGISTDSIAFILPSPFVYVSLFEQNQRYSGTLLQEEVAEDLPARVQSCIRACVHVNLLSVVLGKSSMHHASCASCSSMMHRQMEGAGKSGSHSEKSNGSPHRWAIGTSETRDCIANAEDFQSAQRCIGEGLERAGEAKKDDEEETYDSAFGADVTSECRGLEDDKVLLRDCLDVENGMKQAIKPLENNEQWDEGVDRLGTDSAEQRRRRPCHASSTDAGGQESCNHGAAQHPGFEDARGIRREEERNEQRQIRAREAQIREQAQRREEVRVRAREHSASHTETEEPEGPFSRSKQSSKATVDRHSDAKISAQISYGRHVGSETNPSGVYQRGRPRKDGVHQGTGADEESDAMPSQDVAASKTLQETIANLSRTVASLQHEVAQDRLAESGRGRHAPVVTVSPVINLNVSSMGGPRDLEAAVFRLEKRMSDVEAGKFVGFDGGQSSFGQGRVSTEGSGYGGIISGRTRYGDGETKERDRAGIGQGETGIGRSAAPPSAPLIQPRGGSFAVPVVVSLSAQRGAHVYYTTNGSLPTVYGSDMYTGAFVLPFGTKTTVTAISVLHGQSDPVRGLFDVKVCSMEGRCCRWTVVLARFQALRGDLQLKNDSLAEDYKEHSAEAGEREHAWLSSEVGYADAHMRLKQENRAARYAIGFTEVWGQASIIARRRYKQVMAEDQGERDQLDSERGLIIEIIGILDAMAKARGSSPIALARQGQRIRDHVRELPQGSAGKTALVALASSLGSMKETKEVRALLKSMLNDVATRLSVLVDLEQKALAALKHTEQRLRHWQRQAANFQQLARKAKQELTSQDVRREVLGGSVKADAELATALNEAQTRKEGAFASELVALDALIGKVHEALQGCQSS